MVCEILNDFSRRGPGSSDLGAFREHVAGPVVAVARSIGEGGVGGRMFPEPRPAGAGAAYRLEEEGFWIYWSRRVPDEAGRYGPGQAVVASRLAEKK